MKDFNEILEEKTDKNNSHFNKLEEQYFRERTFWDQAKDRLIKISSPLALTIFTAPFTTASIMIQIADKPQSNILAKKIEITGKQNPLVRTGIYGDNKIYRPFQLKGYFDCLAQLGKEGVRGLYKGNLTGAILGVVNAKIRTYLYEQSNKLYSFSEQWKSNILTILTCTIADFVTLPLIFSQSRLAFQNSLSNFRTYSWPVDVLAKTSPKLWFSGGSILLLKNILFSYSWISFFKDSAAKSFIFSTVLSHVVTYPFMTIIRQLQTNEIGVPMMNQRSENVRQCIVRIWKNLGILGFYRGFFGYAIVHTFLNFIMIQMNIRSGYFQQLPI